MPHCVYYMMPWNSVPFHMVSCFDLPCHVIPYISVSFQCLWLDVLNLSQQKNMSVYRVLMSFQSLQILYFNEREEHSYVRLRCSISHHFRMASQLGGRCRNNLLVFLPACSCLWVVFQSHNLSYCAICLFQLSCLIPKCCLRKPRISLVQFQ